MNNMYNDKNEKIALRMIYESINYSTTDRTIL